MYEANEKKINAVLLIILVVGIIFALDRQFNFFEASKERAIDECANILNNGGKEGETIPSDCIDPSRTVTEETDIMPVELKLTDGTTINTSLVVDSLDTDQTFLMPNGGKIHIYGSKKILIPREKIFKYLNFRLLNTSSDLNTNLKNISGNVTDSSESTDLSDKIIVLPISQTPPQPGNQGVSPSDIDVIRPSLEPSNWLAFYEKTGKSYKIVDTAWLGFFELQSIALRSYEPPEITMVSRKDNEEITSSFILSDDGTIKTLFSTSSSVQTHDN